MRLRPSSLLGPVESPPCIRQRPLPCAAGDLQGSPDRVRAPQRGAECSDSNVVRITLAIIVPALAALAACELELNFDFYRPASVAEAVLHVFADAISNRRREGQIGLPR